ncbi:MAG: lipid-transfer protein [Dehalococcoidia bacterium]
MEDVAIVGAGMHPWGIWPEKNFVQMGQYAVDMALQDANLEWKDIPYVVSAVSRFSGSMGLSAGNALTQWMGNLGIPIINDWNACASGAYALRVAQALVAAGYVDKVLCVAGDKSPEGFITALPSDDIYDMNYQRLRLVGLTNPGWWALLARRRMHEVGTTEAQMAQVKVKNSKHGSLNPNARYKKVFTLEQVMNSQPVVKPLKLFEICATSEGSVAVIVTRAKDAKKYNKKPVLLSAVSCASYGYPEPETGASMVSDCVKEDTTASMGSMAKIAIKNAYEEAGLGPEDLDFAEVYDLATILELLWYEELGLCKYGEAEKLISQGDTQLGGRIPVNTSGGVASFGEVPSAQGLAQVYELVCQLRGEAGARQVKDAKAGLAINMGLMGNCSCLILKR